MNSRPQLLLDAGALISAEARPHGKVIAQCQLALLARRPALLPTVVFAQVWRASPGQHVLSRIRQMCRPLPFTGQTADDVGRLLARSRTSDVVDAAVIVAAIEHNAAVLTSDPKDLAKLASAAEYPVRLLGV
ncbi:MAG: PIN domain-containing protein [Pseudonocardiaceae bacterium]